MMSPTRNALPDEPPSAIAEFFNSSSMKFQRIVDSTAPHPAIRWVSTILIIALFFFRVLYLQAFYIVAYTLAIYLLNLFLHFLSPRDDPSIEEDDGTPALPTSNDEEFRPFIRKLPEFNFWYAATKSSTLSLICTFFDIFDIPVFWPILLVYFFLLFFLTMKRQIKHMIKYKYIPFDFGKKKYATSK